jgi:hypothetical protein
VRELKREAPKEFEAVNSRWMRLDHALRMPKKPNGAKPVKLQWTAIEARLPAGQCFPVWQLAKLLGCHRQHIINLVEQGDLVAFDLRGPGSSRATLRIPRNSMIAFLEARQIIATAEKRATKQARIAIRPTTKSRRYARPADALLAVLRQS